MAKFKSTRDQAVGGKHVKTGDTIEIDADRVRYLITRGHLVEVEDEVEVEDKVEDKKAPKSKKAA